MKRHLIVLGILFAGILALLMLSSLSQSASAQTMPPTLTADRLARPPTVIPKNQADEGHQLYYMVCMACHGDQGQGLTEEWREVTEGENMDCWQSGCHHTKHPIGGFIFPKVVPRVVGGGALARFQTAQEVYDYLNDKMPYQNPGYLKDEEYWQLTAYLLRENGLYDGAALSPENAAQVRLWQPLPAATPAEPQTGGVTWQFAGAVFLLILAVAILMVVYWKSRR